MFGLFEEWDMLMLEAYLSRPLTEKEKERIKNPELHEDSITVVCQNKKRIYHYFSTGDSNQWNLSSIIEDELCTN